MEYLLPNVARPENVQPKFVPRFGTTLTFFDMKCSTSRSLIIFLRGHVSLVQASNSNQFKVETAFLLKSIQIECQISQFIEPVEKSARYVPVGRHFNKRVL